MLNKRFTEQMRSIHYSLTLRQFYSVYQGLGLFQGHTDVGLCTFELFT